MSTRQPDYCNVTLTNLFFDSLFIALGCCAIVSIMAFTVDTAKFLLEVLCEYRYHYKGKLIRKLVEITDCCFDRTMYDLSDKSVDEDNSKKNDDENEDEDENDDEDVDEDETATYGSGKTFGEEEMEPESDVTIVNFQSFEKQESLAEQQESLFEQQESLAEQQESSFEQKESLVEQQNCLSDENNVPPKSNLEDDVCEIVLEQEQR